MIISILVVSKSDVKMQCMVVIPTKECSDYLNTPFHCLGHTQSDKYWYRGPSVGDSPGKGVLY